MLHHSLPHFRIFVNGRIKKIYFYQDTLSLVRSRIRPDFSLRFAAFSFLPLYSEESAKDAVRMTEEELEQQQKDFEEWVESVGGSYDPETGAFWVP